MNLFKSLSPPPGYARSEWPGTSGGKAGFDDVNPAAVGPALSRSLVNVGVSRTDLVATHVQRCRAGPAGGSTCSNLAPPEGKDFRLVPDNEYIDLGLNESLEEMWTMPSSQHK